MDHHSSILPVYRCSVINALQKYHRHIDTLQMNIIACNAIHWNTINTWKSRSCQLLWTSSNPSL